MKTNVRKIIVFLLVMIVLITTVHINSYADVISEISKEMKDYFSKYENI